MSKDRSKKESHQKCNACDFQKLKQLENNPVIRRLRDKIEQLHFRLDECKKENQLLKRNIQLAKKMVSQEVGGEDIDFQALMKYGPESCSKDRQEDVLLLKANVQELKEYLRELEGNPPTHQETPSEDYVKKQMPNDRKKLWRMELERRLARENAEKDINPLFQECIELRRNLDAEKSRFRELTEEVKLLRVELKSQVQKSEEDFGIINSCKTLEKQLEETLAERAEIRQELNGSRARNKRLTEELTSLTEELEVLQKKTRDDNALIDSITSSHKSIKEAIDAEKTFVQQRADRYKEESKVMLENQATDMEILDHLQCIIYDRNDLIDELRKDVDINSRRKERRKQDSSHISKKLPTKESKTLQSSTSKDETPKENADEVEDEMGNRKESDSKIRQLRLECAKYKALCEAAKMESDRLALLIDNQDRKMNEIAVQEVETGRLIMQKNAEKKELFEKVNKMQRSLCAKRRRGKFHLQPKGRFEDLRIKTEAQKEKNDFLRNFLRSAVCVKAKDLLQLRGFIADNNNFFKACFNEIKELLEYAPPDQEIATEASE